MKTYVLLGIGALLIGSCAPNVPLPLVSPPPPKTESALPSVNKVDSNVVETIKTNVKLGAKIEDQKKTITEQKDAIAEALAQIQQMNIKANAKEFITVPEVGKLVEEIQKIELRNNSLEAQNLDLITVTGEQAKQLAEVQTNLNDAKTLITQKESEAEQLRVQYNFLSTNVNSLGKEIEKLKAEVTKQKQISATALVYKRWVWGLVAGFILWTIIKNALMLYLPTTKFRI
jgi:chromosome segregation ATPase